MSDHVRFVHHIATLGSLYDQHAQVLYKIICCHVKNKVEAETILEKTFKEICDNVPQLNLVAMAGVARRLSRQAINKVN